MPITHRPVLVHTIQNIMSYRAVLPVSLPGNANAAPVAGTACSMTVSMKSSCRLFRQVTS